MIFVTPVVEHWLDRNLAQWVDHERTLNHGFTERERGRGRGREGERGREREGEGGREGSRERVRERERIKISYPFLSMNMCGMVHVNNPMV